VINHRQTLRALTDTGAWVAENVLMIDITMPGRHSVSAEDSRRHSHENAAFTACLHCLHLVTLKCSSEQEPAYIIVHSLLIEEYI